MINLILKLLAGALAFLFVLPLIDGIHFHGGPLQAFLMAILFGFMLWTMEITALSVIAEWTLSTLKTALAAVISTWLVGFWLLPTIALKLLASMLPSYLTVNGWLPAVWGGLVMLVAGMLSGGMLGILLQERHEGKAA